MMTPEERKRYTETFENNRTLLQEQIALKDHNSKYRYLLTREWLFGNGRVVFVLLNPSTADESTDDATIRRLIKFSQSWGYQGLKVLNLFALRATDPGELYSAENPVGMINDTVTVAESAFCDKLVVGWGCHGKFMDRDKHVMDLLRLYNKQIQCFEINTDGTPRHPLYLSTKTIPIEYAGRGW